MPHQLHPFLILNTYPRLDNTMRHRAFLVSLKTTDEDPLLMGISIDTDALHVGFDLDIAMVEYTDSYRKFWKQMLPLELRQYSVVGVSDMGIAGAAAPAIITKASTAHVEARH